ncbi:hypothetical protein TNIN_252511, partial [Trichonephila inaurata madagascariensis]
MKQTIFASIQQRVKRYRFGIYKPGADLGESHLLLLSFQQAFWIPPAAATAHSNNNHELS